MKKRHEIGSGLSVTDKIFKYLWLFRGRWTSASRLNQYAQSRAFSTYLTDIGEALARLPLIPVEQLTPREKYYRRWRLMYGRRVKTKHGNYEWQYRLARRGK
jgi:hypothetical protein